MGTASSNPATAAVKEATYCREGLLKTTLTCCPATAAGTVNTKSLAVAIPYPPIH